MTRRPTRAATALAVALSWAVAGCSTRGDVPPTTADQEKTMTSPLLERFATPAAGIRSGGRITADDLPTLRAAGIRHVINLAPASETPGFDEAAAVQAAGMRYDPLPIAGAGDLDRAAVLAFDRLLQAADAPTLVHCGSGNRVGALVALRAAWLQGADEEAAVAEGRRWGLAGLEGEVRERIASPRCVASADRAADGADCDDAG